MEKEKRLEQLKQEYLNDPLEFLKEVREVLDGAGGPIVQKVVFVDDNEIFVKLTTNFDYFKNKGLDMYEVLHDVTHSKVDEVVYISNRVSFCFPNQMGQISFTPENDGICISKVILNPDMEQKPGTGTALMYLFYLFLINTDRRAHV